MPARMGRHVLVDAVVFAITLALVAVAIFQPAILEDISIYLSAFLIIFFGISHGSIDDKLYLDKSGKDKKKFYLTYMAVAGWVLLVFLLSPAIALILFIVISAFHFGQSQFFYLKLPEEHYFKVSYYIIWGALILFTMFFFHFKFIQNLLSQDPFSFFASDISYNGIFIALITLYTLWLLLSTFALFENFLDLASFAREMVGLLLFIVLNIHVDLLLAFALYFGAMHALKSLIIEYHLLYRQLTTANLRKFTIDLLPNTLISIFFLILCYAIVSYYDIIDPFYVFLILGSAISVPHIIFINRIFLRFVPNK